MERAYTSEKISTGDTSFQPDVRKSEIISKRIQNLVHPTCEAAKHGRYCTYSESTCSAGAWCLREDSDFVCEIGLTKGGQWISTDVSLTNVKELA